MPIGKYNDPEVGFEKHFLLWNFIPGEKFFTLV
jgi:hypothetical protein